MLMARARVLARRAQAEAQRAEVEAKTANQVTDFVTGLFEFERPTERAGRPGDGAAVAGSRCAEDRQCS